MGASPYVRIGHVDLFQIVELHNSMSREGSKTDRLKPPIHVSSAKDLDLSNGVIDKVNHPVSDIRSCFGGENGKKSPQMELQNQNLFV